MNNRTVVLNFAIFGILYSNNVLIRLFLNEEAIHPLGFVLVAAALFTFISSFEILKENLKGELK